MTEQHVFDVDAALLRYAGQVLPDSGWHMPLHAHGDLWEFIYFLRGCGRVETPGHILHPQRYHLVVYPPGLSHAEWANPVDPEETIFLVVSVTGECPPGCQLLLPDRDGKLRWLVENIYAEFKTYGRTPLAQSYTHAFLHLVERCWRETNSREHNLVGFALQYIQTHYTEPLTVKQIATAVHVSEAYFSHQFKKQMGISPMRCVQKVRIEAATRLLVTTNLAVSAISTAVGFRDPLHFSRVFKRVTTYTPTQMRSLHAVSADNSTNSA